MILAESNRELRVIGNLTDQKNLRNPKSGDSALGNGLLRKVTRFVWKEFN